MRAPGRKIRTTAGRPRCTGTGFTLVELAVATSILVIGVLSAVSATSQVSALRGPDDQRDLALDALRSQAERLHRQALALTEKPGAWARAVLHVFGPGGTAGNRFRVPGLRSADGDEEVGTIQVLTSETLTDAGLGVELGLPCDLNGDGDSHDGDVRDDACRLPVLLTIRWRGEGGEHVARRAITIAAR
jgi:hypothetical protein